MATKADFTEAEWETLQKGLTGAGLLVSASDRDFSDSFGEAGAMAKYLAGEQVAGPTELTRAIAHAKGTGFGMTASPDKVRDETLAALRAAVALLAAKAPDEVEAYRTMVVGLARAVAEAKHGTSDIELAAIQLVTDALAS